MDNPITTEERLSEVQNRMNNAIKWGQFLMAALLFIFTVAGFIFSLQVADAKLEMRVSTLEKQQADTKDDLKSMIQKLDEIKQQNNDLRLLVEKKQDRPK